MMRLLAASIAALVAGCAAGQPAAKSPQPPAAEGMTLTAADLDRLHALAPDYVARAERAEQRASEAQTAEVASEHHACAQVLLEAAQAEAERVELERALLAEDFRRDAVLRDVAREEYARLAREHSGEQPAAAPVEPARPERAGPPESQRMAADAYIRRARLSLAAARAMGAEPAAIAPAERRIRDAATRPAEARGALEQAERVLESVRARNTPAP
jgi:hypothetical protein